MAKWTDIALNDMRIPGATGAPLTYTSPIDVMAQDMSLFHDGPSDVLEVIPAWGSGAGYPESYPLPTTPFTWQYGIMWFHCMEDTQNITTTDSNLPWRVPGPYTGNQAPNTRVQARHLQMWYLDMNDVWHQLRYSEAPGGYMPPNSWGDEATALNNTTRRVESLTNGGGASVKDIGRGIYENHNWHSFTSAALLPGSYKAIATCVFARLILDDPNAQDDRSQARILMSAAGDYYRDEATITGIKIGGTNVSAMGYARFKYLTPAWQFFGFWTKHSLTEAQLRALPAPPFVGVELINPAPTTPYMQTYTQNEDLWWGRNLRNPTYPPLQYSKAQLTMGRYGSPEAFTTVNPDYSANLSWFTDPVRRAQAWPRIHFWNQAFLGETWKANHMPGWVNNTRIMSWDHQLWVKWKSTGQWQRLVLSDDLGGVNASVQFEDQYYDWTNANRDLRTEQSTGYPSFRIYLDSGAPWVPYWVFHGWSGGVVAVPGLGSTDVADIVCSQKAALIMHDPNGVDDRDYSRFLFNVGCDWYPATSDGVYPGVGTGVAKFVTAKWPNFQYHVLHTMTEAQFKAPGGYPPDFAALTDGGGAGVPPPPGVIDTSGRLPLPSRGNWFPKLTSSQSTWTARSASATPTNIVRRPRRSRLL